MLKAIIVDDEAKSRSTLVNMLNAYCPNVKIVAEAFDVLSAVKEINIHQPDIVFLDIEMPNYSGFKLVECFNEIDFDIVFTTAYEQYAIKAFKVSAAGYLLKPIDIGELVEIVSRVSKRRNGATTNFNISNNWPEKIEYADKITFPSQNSVLYLSMKEIVYFQSDSRYTNIHLINGDQLSTTESLKNCLKVIGPPVFIRVHKSFIINLLHVKRYARGRNSFVIMENENKIDVGNNYKEELAVVISYFLK